MRLSLLATIVVPALTLACCSETIRAQPADPPARAPAPPADANAADAYRAAWSKLAPKLNLAASEVAFTSMGAQAAEGSPAGSWERINATLQDNQAAVSDLMHAAAMTRCDFGLTVAKSDEAVAIGGKLRASARLLRADAARLWTLGQTDAAIDRLVALYSMCGQVSHEPVALMGLVDSALIMLANDTARTMAAGAAGHTLTAAQRDRLLAVIDHLDPNDPAGLARGVNAEGDSLDKKLRATIDETQSKLINDLKQTCAALHKP